jgi:RNA polymerase sigma-70 factor (ECF subfamily)
MKERLPFSHNENHPEESSFEILYANFFTPLYRYVFFRIRDKETVIDIVQTVFMKAFQEGNKLNSATALRFLYTVARNQVIDYWRKKRSLTMDNFDEFVEHQISSDSTPEHELNIQEEILSLHDMVATLPEIQRDMITLRYLQELEYHEIAEITGRTEESIRQAVSRGIKTLQERYSIDAYE